MTPLAIIKQVFQDRSFTRRDRPLTSGNYPTLEYTVQYRETDLNFVLRLMEEYGIYYYFSFAAGDGSSPSDHSLVLADSSTHVALPNPYDGDLSDRPMRPTAPTTRSSATGAKRAPWSRAFSRSTTIITKRQARTCWRRRQERTPTPTATWSSITIPAPKRRESDGTQLTAVLADADHSRSQTWSASGYAPSLTPGYKITRASANTDSDSDDGDYLILRCSHSFGEQNYDSENTGGVGYGGIYELGEGSETYRMPAVTRKPLIVGTQPALVVGQQGEEIDVDDLGRILVQFYWDRKKTPSRRVRVAQFWAGAQRGALFTPRIGDEVRVGYEEGDPDRPLVVGSVYNNKNTVPMGLPGQKNNSGILTQSTKNSSGYSFLLFNDTAGSEVVKLRAQKDLRFKALNNELARHQRQSDREHRRRRDDHRRRPERGRPLDRRGLEGNPPLRQPRLVRHRHEPDVDHRHGGKAPTIYMDADTISLSTGASSFVMTASSITMESPQITKTGDATVKISAPMVSVNGG